MLTEPPHSGALRGQHPPLPPTLAHTAGGKAQSPRVPHKHASSVRLGVPLPILFLGRVAKEQRGRLQSGQVQVQVLSRPPRFAGVVQKQNPSFVKRRRRSVTGRRLHSGIVSAVARLTVNQEGLVRIQLPLPFDSRHSLASLGNAARSWQAIRAAPVG